MPEKEYVLKILIVDCNAKIGGIQKALIGLLHQLNGAHEVDLLLLNPDGPLLNEIPENVHCITTASHFRLMGMAQSDCRTIKEKLQRGFYAIISRFFGQEKAVQLAAATLHRDQLPHYDVAISFSHLADAKTFFGGTAEYVLRKADAARKLCYIHCDYLNSGNRSAYSDRIYARFDGIVCVSESTKAHFQKALPNLPVYAVPNPLNLQQILAQARMDTIAYDPSFLNIVTIARLTSEKGVDRMVRAISHIPHENVRYYVVGEGKERESIAEYLLANGLDDCVFLCGEDANPYRHMLRADLLAVPSYHEAAPMVFQEAKILGLPVLTTRTTSADEMIGDAFGFVVENDDQALEEMLAHLVAYPEVIKQKRSVALASADEEKITTLNDVLISLSDQ